MRTFSQNHAVIAGKKMPTYVGKEESDSFNQLTSARKRHVFHLTIN